MCRDPVRGKNVTIKEMTIVVIRQMSMPPTTDVHAADWFWERVFRISIFNLIVRVQNSLVPY
jgi:hypothetical protein